MKMKRPFVVILVLLYLLQLIVPTAALAQSISKMASTTPQGPCDIYAAAGCPCVAAHSTTRALYASYNGPLYQVMRQSDGKTLDIGVVKPGNGNAGGYADAAAQDIFSANTICWITKVYDQSGKGNDLVEAPPGTFKGPAKGAFDNLPIADMAPITVGGRKAYGVYIMPGTGLRNNNATGIAINDEPEGIYYVINGKHFDSGCCFDYGNSSTNSRAVGTGTMETTYYGTSTAWGSGNGAGPWIMSDMEAGLFSGYNAKKNDVPAIDSWRFVTAIVDGGGGNKWDLRGGDAQKGGLTTFYSGVRPGTPSSNAYFPMNKKGAILLGNGGDNGNGSAGTFYEGVMTSGYPTEATTDAVQANIVAARYDVSRVSLSRVTTFTPNSMQDVTLTFTNTTGAVATGVELGLSAGKGWTALVSGSKNASKKFPDPIAPNATVTATFKVTSPATIDAGFLTGRVDWTSATTTAKQSDVTAQRIRNVFPVKINEVRFGSGSNSTNQFIELYNTTSSEVDISNWGIISTASEWASVRLATIRAGTKLSAHGFYLLGLSTSGLVAAVSPGEKMINVRSTAGLEPGQQIEIDGEVCTITNIGTPATTATTLFIPVSTGPRLTVAAGSTNLPVTNAAGFMVGEKIGIDMGGNYEVATVTSVGKAATQTNLAVAARAGDNTIKVLDNSNMTVGDELTINTGARKELARVKRILNIAIAPVRGGSAGEPGEVELAAPLRSDHMLAVDVSDAGTGISFSPGTRFVHKSGDAVQALGSGITLERQVSKRHEAGAAVKNIRNTIAGYQGSKKPDRWYGIPLSATAGSIALVDASNLALVDGMVYGSRQSNSSANGIITSPEIATLEGDQRGGGCIVVVPTAPRGFQPGHSTDEQANRSYGRFPDGSDSDNNCSDFMAQNVITLASAAAAGTNNIKVASVADFSIGQKIIFGSGVNGETATIAMIGTAGGSTVSTECATGTTVIPVGSIGGFSAGQSISIGSASNLETVVVASVTPARRRFGNTPADTLRVATPLKYAHAADEQVSGSGITLTGPLATPHDKGTPITDEIPTPGAPNRYNRKP